MNPSKEFFMIRVFRYLWCTGILLTGNVLFAQSLYNPASAGTQFASIQSMYASHGRQDTLLFHRYRERFQKEVEMRGQMTLDSLIFYGHAAIREGNLTKYDAGVIRIYLGFASGFIDKPHVDSAKYYAKLAIDKSTMLPDSHLLAKAKTAYGWALVYDHSDYEGAIESVGSGYTIAKELRDTTLIIEIGSKLTKILFQKSDIPESFRVCLQLSKLNQMRRDTPALIYNYYLKGSIYAYSRLYDKQMKTVYQLLQLRPSIHDTISQYYINYAAANGYLFQEQYDSVLYYARLNVAYCDKMKRMPYCYENIAKAFLEIGSLDSAQYYYTKIMDYHVAHGTYIDTYLYLNLGRIQFARGHYPEALAFFKKAEADIEKPSLTTQADIYKWLYTYYAKSGDVNKALFYHVKYKTWSDSLLTDQLGKSVMVSESEELVAQYQLLHKEKMLLTKETEIQALRTQRLKTEANLLYSGIALIILMTGLGYWRLKKRRKLKAQQELLNERLRISRELHDEVGATLSGIAMYSHVAVDQLKHSKIQEASHSLAFMQKSAGEMVSKLSDIVWLLNPQQDTILELIGRLGEYGKQMTQVRNMQMRIDLPSDLSSRHIPLDARRNIYLFCKEAINNAVKYSNGKWVVLQVKSIGHQLIFSITDDGHGFDETIVRHGNGLINMQKRAEDIGAVFHIDSIVNQGTKLELKYNIIQ